MAVSRDSRKVSFVSPAACKLRSAIREPARRLFESLENRLLLTVATDANGWTVVTPAANEQILYVSSSSGSDANPGTSQSAPLASISAAYALLGNGKPGEILFKRGDTFSGNFSYFGDSGASSQDPILISNYGDPSLPRPIIDSGASIAFRTGSTNHDVFIIGLNFTSSTHNPTSPNYTGKGDYGFYDLGGSTDILIEDCQFSYFINDITFQAATSAISNITVRRSQILDAFNTAGHSQGMYAEAVTNLTITDNVFDHDGWNADVPGAGATIYNHDCYLHSSNVNCVVTGNTFASAGSFGLQARAGGIVDNNLFINDPYGWAFGLVNGATTKAGGVTGEAIGNVVMEPRVDTANGWGIGAMIGNLSPNGTTVISHNVFSGEPTGTQPAIILEPGNGVSNVAQEVGINNVTISNNTVYGWGFGLQVSNQYVPGSTGADGLTNVVIKNNNFQANVTGRIINQGPVLDSRYETWSGNTYSSTTAAQSSWFTLQGTISSFATWLAGDEPTASAITVPFVSPNRTIESYMAAQGLPASEAAFLTSADAQNKQNWNPRYFASTVNSYVLGGYIVDSTAPAAVATPPANVTAANYISNPKPTFTVTFTDAVAVNPATISSSAITISGAGGVSLPVTLVGTTGSGTSITATYQVSAPSGGWTSVPYGTYVISVVGGKVADTSGNFTPGQSLAGFNVTVNANPNPPSSAASAPAGFSAVAGASSINITWTDPANDEQSFMLQRATDINFTQNVQTMPLTADRTSYLDTAVSAGATYYYKLTAVNSIGASAAVMSGPATILPPAPVLSRTYFDDGNAARTAVTSASLVFSQPVTVNASSISLVQNPTGSATPISVTVSNPTGDGRTWVVSWTTGNFSNRLGDGSYRLTVHGASISDAFGQTAGGDAVTNFTSTDGPVVTVAARNVATPPHSISETFSQDVSASLSITSLKLANAQSQVVPAASYSWNAATNTATWTYSGALPDGNYSAILAATGVHNADGVALDGNKDGIPGDTFTYNFTVVKPTLSISGASSVLVGATYTLTLAAITDAGQTAPSYLVHWGDGSTSTATAAGKLTHAYTTAGSPITISVDVIDANGTHVNCASLAITVNRATIAVTGNANANPAATYTLNLGAVTDPGFTVSSYIVHWGDGSTNTYTSNGAQTHVFTNTGGSSVARNITVDVVDNSGAGGANFTNVSAGSLSVTVNAYPYVPTTGVLNANVGGNYTLFIGSIVDTGFIVSALSLNWGDGSAPVSFSTSTTQLSHVFLPGAPASDAIRVTLTDNSGTYPNASVFTIAVNPSPTVALTGNSTVNVGGSYALTVGPATDPGQTVTQYLIHWGDGQTTPETSAGTFSHVYTTAGSKQISVDLTDGTGTFANAGSLAVSVAGTATVDLSANNPNANAGGIYTLNLGTVNDPGHTATGYTVHWGDGEVSSAAGGPFTHRYSSVGSEQIIVDLTDNTGTTYPGAGTIAVTVGTPTVSLAGNAGVFVGQAYALTISPPTDMGGTPSQVVIHWGDGTNNSYATDGANAVTVAHAFNAASTVNITADVVDSTGTTTNAGSLSLTVAPPPTVSVSGDSSTTVGATYALTVGPATDAISTVSAYFIHWGDNNSDIVLAYATSPITHVYTTAGPMNIVIDPIDDYGEYAGAATFPITVTNSPAIVTSSNPTVAVSGNPTANAGGVYALSLGAVVDDNGAPSGYVVNWGDGTTTPASSAAAPLSHSYASPGKRNISVELIDSMGNWTSAGAKAVTVNPRPTIALSGNADANATGVYTLNLGAVTDPGYAVSKYTVHWGDGQSGVYSAGGKVTHVYTTPRSAAISVDLTDRTGTFAGAGHLAVAVNAAPKLTISGATTADAGKVYSLTLGAVHDTGYSPTSCTIHWGDGTTSTARSPGVVSHTYAAGGNDAITVDMTDATGTFKAVAGHAVAVAATSRFTTSADIGTAGIKGSAAFSAGKYTVSGAGSNIGSANDSFHFYSASASGNATIIANVATLTNPNAAARAGVMFRATSAANSAFAAVTLTPTGNIMFQWRTTAGAAAASITLTGTKAPRYVKLVRTGNSFAAYVSATGTTWTQIGTARSIVMGTTISAGLAVASDSAKQLCTATFDNVRLTRP